MRPILGGRQLIAALTRGSVSTVVTAVFRLSSSRPPTGLLDSIRVVRGPWSPESTARIPQSPRWNSDAADVSFGRRLSL